MQEEMPLPSGKVPVFQENDADKALRQLLSSILDDGLQGKDVKDLLTKIPDLFAATSFPQKWHRLVFVLYAPGENRILVTRHFQDGRWSFGNVFQRILIHPRFKDFAGKEWSLQFDFVEAEGDFVDLAHVGMTKKGKDHFEIGIDGLALFDKDNKVNLFLPGDAYVHSIMGMQQLRTWLSRRFGPDYQENFRIERFQSASYLIRHDKLLRLYRGLPPVGRMTDEKIRDALELSFSHIQKTFRPDYTFLYFYDPTLDTYQEEIHRNRSKKKGLYYNILRHAGGGIFSLDMAESHGENEGISIAARAIEYLEDQARYYDTEHGPCCFLYSERKGKLGAVGLALILIGKYRKVSGDRRFDAFANALFRHVVGAITETGEFLYYHVYKDEPVTIENNNEYFSFYYPGEALAGLAACWDYVDSELQDLARSKIVKALDYLIDIRPIERADKYLSLPSDAWLMNAILMLWPLDPLFRKAGYRHFVFSDADKMIAHMYRPETAPYPDYAGSFYYDFGDYPYADGARLEGLIAAWEFAVLLDDLPRAERLWQAIEWGAWSVGHLVNTADHLYAVDKPDLALGGIRLKHTRSWFRIDTIQHVACFLNRVLTGRKTREKLMPVQTGSSQLISSSELASICDGVWHDLPEERDFSGFAYHLRGVSQGAVFLNRTPGDFPEISEPSPDILYRAADAGAVAFISRDKAAFAGRPWLQVANVKSAFHNIARHYRQSSAAKVVLVTGSYGKTGFKYRLKQLLEPDCRVSAVDNSANEDSGVYQALTKLCPDTDIALVEVSASNEKRTLRRAKLVAPHIAVITSIGHEHIHRHGDLETVIRRKASVVTGLEQNGVVLVPEGPFAEKLIRAIADCRDDVEILLFGKSGSCAARIVECSFENFGWNVLARIQGKDVSYRVPFIENYSVEASLAELLVADLTGQDIIACAARYAAVENLDTSGKLYQVELGERRFILYDQSRRGGIENYQRCFETLAQIQPAYDGRKLLLTSAFMDIADGDIDYVKPGDFQTRIQNADIDHVFTVEHFPEHKNVLPEGQSWISHRHHCKDMYKPFTDFIASDDFVVVKGIFESELHTYLQYLRDQGAKISAFEGYGKLPVRDRLQMGDYKAWRHSMADHENLPWCSFFPFLYCFSKQVSTPLLSQEKDGELDIFCPADARQPGWHFDSYVIARQLSTAQIEALKSDSYRYRDSKTANIRWVAGSVDILTEHGFDLLERPPEYLYIPERVLALKGPEFKNLRYNLRRFDDENPDHFVRAYKMTDFEECLALLRQWRVDGADFTDEEYTINCLRLADRLTQSSLIGKVLIAKGRIVAFGFGGEMNDIVGNIFIVKSDLAVRGASFKMKYELITALQHCAYVNDSSDLGNDGLKSAKKSFAPDKMLPVFRARAGY